MQMLSTQIVFRGRARRDENEIEEMRARARALEPNGQLHYRRGSVVLPNS